MVARRRKSGKRSFRKRGRSRRRKASSSTYFSLRKNYKSARSYRRGSKMGRIARTYGSVRRKGLSSCAKEYIEVLYNPFNPRISGMPCIPDWHQAPSHKFFLRKRFTFQMFGTSGTGTDLGYVLLNPYTIQGTFTNAASATHTCNPIAYTNGTGGAATVTSVVTTAPGEAANTSSAPSTEAVGVGVTLSNWDSDYTEVFALNNSGNKIRVVGAGIRISYAGKWEDLQGTYCVWKHPNNLRSGTSSLASNTLTFDQLLQEDTAAFGALAHNQELVATYHPVDVDDFEYQFASDQAYVMGIVIRAPTTFNSNQPQFMCECIGWYEIIGPGVNAVTPSQSDANAIGPILSSYQKQLPEAPPAAVASSVFDKVAMMQFLY